jgi:hypothetical protein
LAVLGRLVREDYIVEVIRVILVLVYGVELVTTGGALPHCVRGSHLTHHFVVAQFDEGAVIAMELVHIASLGRDAGILRPIGCRTNTVFAVLHTLTSAGIARASIADESTIFYVPTAVVDTLARAVRAFASIRDSHHVALGHRPLVFAEYYIDVLCAVVQVSHALLGLILQDEDIRVVQGRGLDGQGISSHTILLVK